MKLFLALSLIYLFGVDAKHKSNRSNVERRLQRDGFKSPLGFGARNLTSLSPSIDHGNIVVGPPKYGHFGLKVDTEGKGNSPNGTNAEQARQLNAVNVGRDISSKVEQSNDPTIPTKTVETRGQIVAIKSQGSQPVIYNSIEPQPSNVGQTASFYGSMLSQLYEPPAALGNVQIMQSSNYGPHGSNPFYGAAPVQGSQIGTPYGQNAPGQYPIGQPVSSPLFAPALNPGGQVGAPLQQAEYLNRGQLPGFPGFGIGVGQGPFGQKNIPLSAEIGQLTNYYRAVPVTNTPPQSGQQGVPGQWDQNGQNGVHGFYPGNGQQTNYYGATPGNNIQGQPGSVWPTSMGIPGNPRQIAGPLTAPSNPQLGLITELHQYVPGLYGGVEQGVESKQFGSGHPSIHALSRYINTGFYYPPPQHLNQNPNAWDPSARYFFALNGQETPQDASLPASSNPFPITYSQI